MCFSPVMQGDGKLAVVSVCGQRQLSNAEHNVFPDPSVSVIPPNSFKQKTIRAPYNIDLLGFNRI